MGIETALIVGGLSVASTIGEYNAAKSDARAAAKEAEIAMENRKQEILQLAAQQKMGYLDSGLELEGTAQNVIQDSYNTGIEDLNDMESAANTNLKNQMTQARASLISGLASSAISMYSMGGFGGVGATTGATAGASDLAAGMAGTQGAGNITFTNASYMG